jgi:hypothetical protein
MTERCISPTFFGTTRTVTLLDESDSVTPPWEDRALVKLFTETVQMYGAVPNVNCVDIGFVEAPVSPVRLEDLAVRVHFDDKVSQKLRVRNLTEETSSPRVVGLQAMYRTCGARPASMQLAPMNSRLDVHEIVRPGVGIRADNVNASDGTLGLFVRRLDDSSGTPHVLSCWHVLGDTHDRPDDPRHVVNQGTWGDQQKIAHLTQSYKNAHGDMALARIVVDQRKLDPTQWRADRIVGVRRARVGDRVKKSGVKTGVTTGVIDGIGVYMDRSLSTTSPLRINSFRVRSEGSALIADHRDSGAVWYDCTTHEGLGLLFAGTPASEPNAGNYAIAAHLDRVFAHLGVDLWR